MRDFFYPGDRDKGLRGRCIDGKGEKMEGELAARTYRSLVGLEGEREIRCRTQMITRLLKSKGYFFIRFHCACKWCKGLCVYTRVDRQMLESIVEKGSFMHAPTEHRRLSHSLKWLDSRLRNETHSNDRTHAYAVRITHNTAPTNLSHRYSETVG